MLLSTLAVLCACILPDAGPTERTPTRLPVTDTVAVVREAALPARQKSLPKELAMLKKSSSDYRLIAFGGSLTAGFQNGGLFREGQQWAYPNLLARQVGVRFEQPLFSKNRGNGTGYVLPSKVKTPAGNRAVTNNLAVTGNDGRLEPAAESDLHNFAVPYFSKRMDKSGHLQEKTRPFAGRFNISSLSGRKSPSQWEWFSAIDSHSDMFIFEVGFDDLVHSILNDGAGISQIAFENIDQTDEMKAIERLVANGSKGLLVNVPDVASLPYFRQYSWEIIKKYPVQLKVRRSTSALPVDFDPLIDLLLPGETAQKIVERKLSGTILLKDHEVLSADPYDDEVLIAAPQTFNKFKIARAAEKHDLAVADLYTLYQKILAGSYSTHDGVQVDPEWPGGNFFSSDGLYPTFFGQAVIANECILALNRHYGLTIPLIATKNLTTTR